MLLVIHVSHKSTFQRLFTLSHKGRKARGCRTLLEGWGHAHVHQLPRHKPRRERASCQLLGPLDAVSCPTLPVAPGTSPAFSPPVALSAKTPIFFLGCSHQWKLEKSPRTLRFKGAGCSPAALLTRNTTVDLPGANRSPFLTPYMWRWWRSWPEGNVKVTASCQRALGVFHPDLVPETSILNDASAQGMSNYTAQDESQTRGL